ncbi:RsmB/NOP family class I SAM-dependent RNA methyltransferase [Maridesulfovibrio bastinii]|uniref:RsmB/NOP family class I SAM-dependent RNA methyltransferase n=1 Tax=Maridesulfovibrio bastinii TaxID=47157 RepID=UPI000400B3F0|nr:RsmB/NOP family class I SAM-dependent RNA methyltransferase [Maridesulfovibrio bastinii]
MKNKLRTFRLVCREDETSYVEDLLRSQGFDFEPEPFYSMARVLTNEPFPLGDSLAARFGRIYIQDRSSMLPPLMLAPDKGAAAIDMCASPGSKTGLLALLTGQDGFVLASEPSRDRLATLRQNLRRVQAVNSATVNYESQNLPLPSSCWEWILLDPPCSGWGTVEKNPKVMELWGEGKTAPLVTLQKQLLQKAYDLLAPGGKILYSTCTTNIEENEEQTRFATEELGFELLKLPYPAGFTIAEPLLPNMDGVLRVDGSGGGQGFYLCALRKKEGLEAEKPDPCDLPGKRLDLNKISTPDSVDLSALPDGELYDFNGKALFLHRHALKNLPREIRWMGFPVGKVVKNIFRPDPFARVLLPETPDKKALVIENSADLKNLLTGQSLEAADKGKTQVGLFYKNLRLGFVSQKGRRYVWSEK